MASHSLPIPVAETRERAQADVSGRVLPLGTALAIFVALLILFAWLHLIMALQIAATNRQIQSQTEEMNRLVRYNDALLLQIGQAQTPEDMQQRAMQLGLEPKQPLYLPLEQVGPTEESNHDDTTAPASGSRAGAAVAAQGQSVLAILLGQFDGQTEPRTEP